MPVLSVGIRSAEVEAPGTPTPLAGGEAVDNLAEMLFYGLSDPGAPGPDRLLRFLMTRCGRRA